jgi:hypothetical protein
MLQHLLAVFAAFLHTIPRYMFAEWLQITAGG